MTTTKKKDQLIEKAILNPEWVYCTPEEILQRIKNANIELEKV